MKGPCSGRADEQRPMAKFFRIRNFERFQHYKDRNPPWIRLYGALWRDRAFFRLPDAVKAHLIGLFALAARLDNRIPDDPEWLAHELCASEPIDFGALVASGFLIPEDPASVAQAECNPADTASVSESDLLWPKTGGENVRDGIKECSADSQPCLGLDGEPNGAKSPTGEPVAETRKGKRPEAGWPAGFALDDDLRQFAARLGIDADREFEAWRDDCAAHDRRYADWRAAWRGRCRNALRFGARGAGGTRASPAESTMEVALRRLREASERERSGNAS
jgi:hypothetical protein